MCLGMHECVCWLLLRSDESSGNIHSVMDWIVPPIPQICWSPKPQYRRMWSYWVLNRGDQVKTRMALIWYDLCPCKTGTFGHRDRRTQRNGAVRDTGKTAIYKSEGRLGQILPTLPAALCYCCPGRWMHHSVYVHTHQTSHTNSGNS